MVTTRPVVVGVDGSDCGATAVEWAVREARRDRAPLRLVHGFDLQPSFLHPGYPPAATQLAAPIAAARRMLVGVQEDLRSRYPDLIIEAEFAVGSPAGLLAEQSAQGRMVVVGVRGCGGFARLPVGSVATQVAAHADGAVVVIRPQAEVAVARPRAEGAVARPRAERAPGRPVVVGVDDSPEGAAAVGFALDAAAARGAGVVALLACPAVADLPADFGVRTAEPELVLLEQLAGWREKYPLVPVEARTVRGVSPGLALVIASREAALLVVGGRRTDPTGMALGTISRTVVEHAACSVAVVHPEPRVDAAPPHLGATRIQRYGGISVAGRAAGDRPVG